MEELPHNAERTALAGRGLVAGGLPPHHLPPQLLHVEAHLCHKTSAHGTVDIVGPDVPGLDELVEEALGILHCPVAVDSCVGVC